MKADWSAVQRCQRLPRKALQKESGIQSPLQPRQMMLGSFEKRTRWPLFSVSYLWCAQVGFDEVNEHPPSWYKLAQDIPSKRIPGVPTPAIVQIDSMPSSFRELVSRELPSCSIDSAQVSQAVAVWQRKQSIWGAQVQSSRVRG